MSIDALVGHSGFVGGVLAREHAFKALFNTSNIDAIANQHFDTVICAAAPGSMFTANREHGRDRAQIDGLIQKLDTVRARRFVLISSIAVLADFGGGDYEDSQVFQRELAYGRHRRMLEAFCENRFDDCLVVRLPALYGPGLRKNFLFDLLNPVPTMLTQAGLEMLLEQVPPAPRGALARFYTPDSVGMQRLDRDAFNADPLRAAMEADVRATEMSATQFHNPASTYQYYDMSRLWRDIGIASEFDLSRVHLVTEPLLARDIYTRLIGTDMPYTDARLHYEDMRTRHAALWGREGNYLEDASTVLDKLAAFFAAQRRTS